MSTVRLTLKTLRSGRLQPQKNGKPFGKSSSRAEALRQLYELTSGHDVVVVHHETSRRPKGSKKK